MRMQTISHNQRITTSDLSCPILVKVQNLWECHPINNRLGLRKAKQIFLPCEPLILENNLKEQLQEWCQQNLKHQYLFSHPYNDPPEVLIEDWGITLIRKHVQSEEYQEELIEAYRNNKRSTIISDYGFYTDGSMITKPTGETKMGMAWIQATGPTPRSHFLAGITDWPSAYKAESAAILTAILTVPENSKVAIYTDSSACIAMMKKILCKDPRFTHKRWIKEKNWSL